ncbi:MAG: hypothetical protein RI919_982 [Actinomycetota bacterium]
MILKGCWYFIVIVFFASLAVYFFGNAAGWVIGLFALSFVGAIVYKVLTAGKADAAALAMQQVRVAQKFVDVLPLDLADQAKSAPRLVPEGSGDGWTIDTDGYTQVPQGDEPLELTLVCQSAANAGTNTVLVALGQLVIGKVKSDQLEELYQAVMSAGGVARCVGTVSQIDVAKPFGIIKGE